MSSPSPGKNELSPEVAAALKRQSTDTGTPSKRGKGANQWLATGSATFITIEPLGVALPVPFVVSYLLFVESRNVDKTDTEKIEGITNMVFNICNSAVSSTNRVSIEDFQGFVADKLKIKTEPAQAAVVAPHLRQLVTSGLLSLNTPLENAVRFTRPDGSPLQEGDLVIDSGPYRGPVPGHPQLLVGGLPGSPVLLAGYEGGAALEAPHGQGGVAAHTR